MIICFGDENNGQRSRCLALLALCACASLPKGTAQPTLHKSDLQSAFAQCEAAEVIKETPAQYYALACEQVAIYHCDGADDPDDSLCVRVAAGHVAEVLPRDRSHHAKKDRADLLFERGRDLEKDGRLLEACDLFSESDELLRTFGSALNLADCEAHDGHAEYAWRLYGAAAVIAEDERRARSARNLAASIAATKLCTLVITIPDPDVAGLTVHIGDRAITPAAVIHTAVEPTTISVVVEAPNAPPFRQTVHAVAGMTVPIAVPAYRPRVASPLPAAVP